MVEPDPFSPAGTVERYGQLSNGLRRRWGKAAVWTLLGLMIGLPLIAWLSVLVVHHH
jgi:hypothetical protein